MLAGVTQNGLYRKEGANWSQVTGGPLDAGASGNGYFAWKNGGPVVYCIAPNGVWRSLTAGTQGSWVKIHAATAGYSPFNCLVLDPINPANLYISESGQILRITNAETSTGVANSQVDVLSVANTGSIAVNKSGHLLVHSTAGRIYRALDPRAGSPVFTVVSDNFYLENGSTIRSFAVGIDDYIYTADNGKGAMVGVPQY